MFLMILVLAWVGLVRMVVKTEWWKLCAGIYCCSVLFLMLAWGAPLHICALLTLWMGGLAAVHFWLLVDVFEAGSLWFLVLVLGFALMHAPLFLV
jgi:hypothetical protein